MQQAFQVRRESVKGVLPNRIGSFSMIKRLREEEAITLLSEGTLGHVGCVTERGPYVVPANYIFYEGNIYVYSLMGSKIKTLRQNPKACFQVDKSDNEYSWRSVIAFGRYEELTDAEERYGFMQRLLTRFPHLTPVESVSFEATPDKIIIFRIRVEQVSAVGEV